MEKEPTKKRTEIMRIRGTDNRTLKDDLKSRRQLIVIRVNGWADRGRNEKTKQTIRTGKTHMTNKSVTAIKHEYMQDPTIIHRSNVHALHKRSKDGIHARSNRHCFSSPEQKVTAVHTQA